MKFLYKLILMLLFIIPFKNVYADSGILLECPNGGKIGDVIECNINANSDIEISALSIDLRLSDNLKYINFKTDSGWQGDGNLGKIYLYTYPNKIGNFKVGTVTFEILKSDSSSVDSIYLENINFYKADFSKFSISDVYKEVKILSDNNYLSSLSINGHDISPQFNRNIFEYKAKIDDDNIVIDAKLEDEKAIINGIGLKKLDYGDNTFIITVTSESGIGREYKLIVTRDKKINDEEIIPDNNENKEEAIPDNKDENKDKTENNIEVLKKDNNSKLSKLVIKDYNVDFYSNIYEYSLEVESEISILYINAVAESKKALVTIRGNDNIVYGNNEIIITVTAEDGSKSIYKINVLKKSNDCIVNNINILNYDLEFNCNKYDYELKIDYEDSLNIDVIPSNEFTNINILNNSNLKHNDVINIVAKYDDVEYVYNIKILTNSFILGELFNTKQIVFISVILIFVSSYLIIRTILNKKLKRNFNN